MSALLSYPSKACQFCVGKGSNDTFQALKQYLAHLPKVASLIHDETLLLYLAISEQAMSVVLVVERSKEQITVYF